MELFGGVLLVLLTLLLLCFGVALLWVVLESRVLFYHQELRETAKRLKDMRREYERFYERRKMAPKDLG
jgi:hypothetical protein